MVALSDYLRYCIQLWFSSVVTIKYFVTLSNLKVYQPVKTPPHLRDQARGQNEGEVFLNLGRKFCPSFILTYIFYTFRLLSQLRTWRSLILLGDNFFLVSLKLDP